MSALGNLATGAGSALVSQLWKVATFVLASLLLAVGSGAGTGLWMVSAARDLALADLKTAQAANGTLTASLSIQNTAITSMSDAVKRADVRRDEVARQLSASITSAKARATAATTSTATSCDAVLREAWGEK